MGGLAGQLPAALSAGLAGGRIAALALSLDIIAQLRMPPADKKVNIVFIGTQMEVAGAQRVLLSQARWFHAHGHQVKAIFLYDKQDLKENWQAKYDFPVTSLQAWGVGILSPFALLIGLVRLFVLLRQRIDIVVSFTPHSNLVALPIGWLAGVPVRIGTHHGHIDGTGASFAHLHGWLTNSGFCSAMVAVSRQVYNFAIDQEKVKPAKLTVIENGIEPSAEKKISAQERASLRSGLGVSDNQVLFITVGRLTRQKGHADLLDAVALLKNNQAVFVFAGEGPLRAELEERAQRLQVSERVRFLGIREDVAQLLSAADVFVQPSLWEGLSLALLEALFAGLPVLSTKVEGTVDIVEDGDSAILVPVGDGDALATAIDMLAQDASLRSRLAKNGKQRVEARYSVDRMCADYLQLINKLKPA